MELARIPRFLCELFLALLARTHGHRCGLGQGGIPQTSVGPHSLPDLFLRIASEAYYFQAGMETLLREIIFTTRRELDAGSIAYGLHDTIHRGRTSRNPFCGLLSPHFRLSLT
jgi:hypothetical protein